jgi:hypothetical protein
VPLHRPARPPQSNPRAVRGQRSWAWSWRTSRVTRRRSSSRRGAQRTSSNRIHLLSLRPQR